MHRIIAAFVLSFVPGIAWAVEAATDAATDARPAIERGLKFLAGDGLKWKETRKCASCHHGPMTIWSLNVAKKRGYGIDEKALAELTSWVVAKDSPSKVFQNPPPPAVAPEEKIANQASLMLALALAAGDTADEATRAGLVQMYSSVVDAQRPDGSWRLMYVWQPIGSTPDVITNLALLALVSKNAPDLGPLGMQAREKGLAWLSAAKPDESLQGTTLKMLLWRRLPRPDAEWQALRSEILSQQNPDGGWSQTRELPSDAYATGQVLYALMETELPTSESSVARAQAFLVKSQQPDGSWAMTSQEGGPGGKRAKDLAPISFTGTAWAVMGLACSSPPPADAKTADAK